MELSSFSPMAHKPCLLMKFAKATILLDSAVNLETLGKFYPYTVAGKYSLMATPEVGSRAAGLSEELINAVPEVQPVLIDQVEIENIDAILISNWSSLFGLPFITQRNKFYGAVYCTVPTKELGELAMQELQMFLASVKAPTFNEDLRNRSSRLSTTTMLDASFWRPIFTAEEIERCLSRIVPISFGETKLINGIIKCTAYSSGYAIGSCNWIIEVESTKFGYVSSSSAKSTHMRPCDWNSFKDLDYLIFTSIARSVDTDPHKYCGLIRSAMADALKNGGNVLFPVNSIGYIYDLLEVIFGALEEYKISRDIPVYFISTAAASSLAFINTFTEWLKKEKAVKVYNTEEPFAFSELVRENRIKVYDSITGTFSRECKTPCIVLTGHPSLHVGNVVSFLQLWGQDRKSVVIATDPEYPLKEMYKPYRNLLIRAYDYPIETRLDMKYVNECVLPELKPKMLIIPKEYASRGPSSNDVPISYENFSTFSFGDKSQRYKISNRKRALLDVDVLKSLDLKPKRPKTQATSNLRGFLSTYDNDFEIIKTLKPEICENPPSVPHLKFTGVLTPENVIKVLREHGMKGEHGASIAGECSLIRIPELKAEIRIEAGGLSSRIRCRIPENRKRIQQTLMQCLEEL